MTTDENNIKKEEEKKETEVKVHVLEKKEEEKCNRASR